MLLMPPHTLCYHKRVNVQVLSIIPSTMIAEIAKHQGRIVTVAEDHESVRVP